MKPDPAIEAVREARRRISARFEHDPEKLVRDYMQLQRELTGRVISASDTRYAGGERPESAGRVAEPPPREP
jgi:hypothetical protein